MAKVWRLHEWGDVPLQGVRQALSDSCMFAGAPFFQSPAGGCPGWGGPQLR